MIRRGTALAAILLSAPVPAYAHSADAGTGVEIELLLVAGVVLVAGFKLRSTPGRGAAGAAVMILGVLGVAAALLYQGGHN